jgi:hypothetical protein
VIALPNLTGDTLRNPFPDFIVDLRRPENIPTEDNEGNKEGKEPTGCMRPDLLLRLLAL